MALALDPGIHRVWRSPHTLQFGVQRPVVVLDAVGVAEERMLVALAGGVSRNTLRVIARQAGATEDAVESLLTRLAPVLVSSTTLTRASPAPGGVVVLDGVGRTAAMIAGFLREGGLRVIGMVPDDESPATAPDVPSKRGGPPVSGRRPDGARADTSGRSEAEGEYGTDSGAGSDLSGVPSSADAGSAAVMPPAAGKAHRAEAEPHAAVLVAAFAIEPRRHLRWLRRDIPHLPVVFGDAEVVVGPLILPGQGACVRCGDLERRDADPAWPAMAAQLYTAEPPGETPSVASAVAPIAAGTVLAFLSEHAVPRRGAGESNRRASAASAAGTLSPAPTFGPAFRDEQRYDPAITSWRRETRVPHPECGCVTPVAVRRRAPRVRKGSAIADG